MKNDGDNNIKNNRRYSQLTSRNKFFFDVKSKSKQLAKLADNVAQSWPTFINILIMLTKQGIFSLRQHIGGYSKSSQHFGQLMLTSNVGEQCWLDLRRP